jgi:DNA end-binding protein Ku
VPWEEVVKGYEYEKGKFVVLRDEDFRRVDVEATQTVNIINFVSLKEVNPLLFHKPYYLEAGKGGEKAYVLLREALNKTGKIAIAKVVIRIRQHLAAIKPQKDDGLILELMHFPDELLDVSKFKQPHQQTVGKAEMRMAEELIRSMTSTWKPELYRDEYHKALEKLINEKVRHGSKTAPVAQKKRKTTNVIDLVSVLQQSIQTTQSKKFPKHTRTKTARSKFHKKAA